MSTMIELQVINKILNDSSMAIIVANDINEDYFLTYVEEFEFILTHSTRYSKVPDKETFVEEFPDFEFFRVNESEEYLIETLKEQYLFVTLVPIVNKVAELTKVDANEAVDYMRNNLDKLNKVSAKYKAAYDLVKQSSDRKVEFKTRLDKEGGLLGISTGIEELDNITHGWLGEDLITIVGRTNEGKSWLLLFFLVMAWKAGVHVLLYSGEMSDMIVGFRFDTLNENFNHTGLTAGKEKLGNNTGAKSSDDYFEYLDNLSNNEVPFYVVTPKSLGKRLDVPMLNALIDQYNPGIIGIDQLSLMEDARAKKGDQERTRYTHISEDLFETSERRGIPILSPAQANRDGAKETKEDEKTPELHHVAESDGVVQNSSRVITMKQIGMTMKISIKKNRYGPKNIELLLIWDVENGIIRPFLQVASDNRGQNIEVQKTPSLQGAELF